MVDTKPGIGVPAPTNYIFSKLFLRRLINCFFQSFGGLLSGLPDAEVFGPGHDLRPSLTLTIFRPRLVV